MPELPEVETTRRGIAPSCIDQMITQVIIRNPQLRWSIPQHLRQTLVNTAITHITRRAKYLLLTTPKGTLLIHLGMSGCLRIINQCNAPVAGPHDHFELSLANGMGLRLTDPRRFGAVLWIKGEPEDHPLLKNLGPEPLSEDFSADALLKRAHGRKQAIKLFLMNSHNVVGIGNIYANEILFASKIHPQYPAGKIDRKSFQAIVKNTRRILTKAIKQGGTTLKDFHKSDGKPGYFRQHLRVYGREGMPCPRCQTRLKALRLNQRISVYCSECQRL